MNGEKGAFDSLPTGVRQVVITGEEIQGMSVDGSLQLPVRPADRPESGDVTQVMGRVGRDQHRRPDGGACARARAVPTTVLRPLVNGPVARLEDRAEAGDPDGLDERLRRGRTGQTACAEGSRQDGGRNEPAARQPTATRRDLGSGRSCPDGIAGRHRAGSSLVVPLGVTRRYGPAPHRDGSEPRAASVPNSQT